MKKLLSDLWFGEPTLILALIRAVLVALVLIWWKLPPEQAFAVYGIVEAVTAIYNRSRVIPVPEGLGGEE